MSTERVLFQDSDREIVLIDEGQIALDEFVIDTWVRESVYCDTDHPKSDGRWLEVPGHMLARILDHNRSASLPRCLEVLKGLAPDVAQSFTDLLASPELAKRAGDGIDSRINFILTTCAQQFKQVEAAPEG